MVACPFDVIFMDIRPYYSCHYYFYQNYIKIQEKCVVLTPVMEQGLTV
jgi:hypothetical protein